MNVLFKRHLSHVIEMQIPINQSNPVSPVAFEYSMKLGRQRKMFFLWSYANLQRPKKGRKTCSCGRLYRSHTLTRDGTVIIKPGRGGIHCRRVHRSSTTGNFFPPLLLAIENCRREIFFSVWVCVCVHFHSLIPFSLTPRINERGLMCSIQ